ncbi:dystrophin [Sarotherodon galilaeus]
MSDYLVGVAGPNSIGISSLKSLFDQTNISDEVIDGLIYLQCEKNIFQMYEKLIGACLENGSHWTLFFCDIPKRTMVYMNSFGESEVRKSAVLKNWSSFASARGCIGEWTLSHVSHPHQQDGNSCGVHVIMFAQSLIEGKTHVEEYNTEIPKLRSRLCHYLFSSIDRTRKCSQCWCVIAAKDRVQCQKCGAYKHMRCSKSVCGICIFCETQCSTAEGKELCSIVGGYTGGAIEVASEECHQGKHQAANDKGKVPKGEDICSKPTSNSEIGGLTVRDEGTQTERDEGTQTEDKEKETEVYSTSLSTDNAADDDVDRIDADTEFQTDSEGTSTVYRVHGRLSVPSSKKKTYTITEDEIKRRIQAENMSVHVFRGLIGGRKAKLPAMILDRPKKAKTKVTLALGLAGRLACDVTRDMVCKGIDHSSADMTKQTLRKIQHNLKQELTDSSTFSLLTHTFGPAALDSVISFLCEKLDLVS